MRRTNVGSYDVTVLRDGEKWAFDENVTKVFDNMLERSIPQYRAMRDLSTAFALDFAIDGTVIVDLGCSRGEALKRIVSARGDRNRYLGVEVSEPMLAAAAAELAGYVNTGILELQPIDLRYSYPLASDVSVTMAVFTLQFIPLEYRQQVIRSVYESLIPGGALIVCEKVLGAGSLEELMVRHYLDMKRANGYTEEEIESKRKSLEGVLAPLTAEWNIELIRSAGFKQVDCFWRWLNFAGWVAVK